MHTLRFLSAALVSALLAACGGSASEISKLPTADSGLDTSSLDASSSEASSPDASLQWPVCSYPTPVDAGPGACRVGRAQLYCTYPYGVTCDDGMTWTSPSGPVGMLCVTDDPTGCPGCHPIAGTATCESKCAPNQFVMECGGVPRYTDAGPDHDYYEEPPATCTLVTPTPAGVAFWCCPCE
jgi:hypothetical protein